MNLLNDYSVKRYIKSLEDVYPSKCLLTVCGCMEKGSFKTSHSQNVAPVSSNLAELAATHKASKVRNIVMYITATSYFNGDMMKFLINEMLDRKDDSSVEQYYTALDQNLRMHPPCASYMTSEYEHLFLKPYRKCFREMTLWEYLMETFNRIISGSLSLGEGNAFDLAFRRCLSFCVKILQIDFEVCKTTGSRALIMKCLNYKLERRTRMHDICKILDGLFFTGYDIRMPIINLALLVNQMMAM
ncbi:uncharacterized protein LOC126840231 [Adelges cooleyi]|uniref:uncharacterized protein LOC126840231 n=1 Tax=Adelges cooleyi TaxID=133065 RepID=UPI00217FD7FE|nr:uncharacterized protein LOC126840231 [Adelges cooleyi]